MLIVVGREKSESIRFMPGMVAINSSSSVAEKTTPGKRGAPSCLIKARTSPRTLTVSPGKIDIGRNAGSSTSGSSQSPALMRIGIFEWAGLGMEPVYTVRSGGGEGEVNRGKKDAGYLNSVRIYSVQ